MKVVSWNLNGLMATMKNGHTNSLLNHDADIICFQEIRTNEEPIVLPGYLHYWNHAEQKGYAGTAMLFKRAPLSVECGFRSDFSDADGRVMTADLGDCYVVTAYVPNSQKNLKTRAYRMEWDEEFRSYVTELAEEKSVIICGDFNVARSSIDIFSENMRQYWAEQGYISDERNNLEALIEEGFTDVFRELHPDERSYTWWSNRLYKRSEGRGWRLDYFFVSDELMPKVKSITHHHEIEGSDHCPIELEVSV